MKKRGFTLVEMVVALTIIAILLSLAFPAMKALAEDDEPTHVTGMLDLSRFLRARAMSENRPYQMVFDQQHIYGLRYFYPYQEETTVTEFLTKLEEERVKRKEEIARMEVERLQLAQDLADPNNPPPPPPNIDDEYFVRKLALPKDMRVEVRPWGDVIWKPLDGTAIHRWVFQPSGLCDPMLVRFGIEGRWHELSFEVLTGDLGTQRFYAQ